MSSADDLRGWEHEPDGDTSAASPSYLWAPGGADDGLDHGEAGGDDDLHGDGDRRDDELRGERERDGDGQSAADGERELGDDLRGWEHDPDGDASAASPSYLWSPGGADDGLDHGDVRR